MSEESLRNLLERLNSDEAYRASVAENPVQALQDADLSPAEAVALASNDEDSLRRLVGAETSGYAVRGELVSPQKYSDVTRALPSFGTFNWYSTYKPLGGCQQHPC